MSTKVIGAMALLLTLALAPPGWADALLDRLHNDRSTYGMFSGDGVWRLKERIWLPAAADNLTVGLFPLDPVDETKEADRVLNDALETKGGDSVELLGQPPVAATKQPGLELKDAGTIRVKQSAYGLGDGALVANGRHGGALQLRGGKSMLKLPDYSLPYSFTVEAWFRPEQLGGTLMYLTIGPHDEALVLSLTPEGQVALRSRGKPLGVSQRRLTPGTFTHVAFVYRERFFNKQWYPHDCLLSLDGFPQVWVGANVPPPIASLGTPLLLGNTPAGDAPFVGLVDDVRVSAVARDFCQNDDAECDPRAQRVVAKAPPVMRGKEELVLDAPLDGSTQREGQFTAALLPATARAAYVTARRGQGLLVDPQRGVRFRPTAPLPAGEGALEFWFMPHDWDNNQICVYDPAKEGQNFRAPIFQLVVRANPQANPQVYLSLVVDRTSETKGCLIPYFLYPLLPGTWRHAVVTWQGADVKLYIDGREYADLLGNHPVYLMRPNPGINPAQCQLAALEFGGFWCYNASGATVIDEVKLYRHRLTPVEITNAYQRFFTHGKVQPLPPIEFKVAMNHPEHRLTATVDLLMPERHQTTAFDLAIVKTTAANAVIATKAGVPLDDGHCFLELAQPQIGYGEYLFKFAFKNAAGDVLRTVEAPHVYPQPAWVDNTLGVHDGEVMPPWTPMDYREGTVTCWGRELTIGPAGWPVRIRSQGQVILPRGPELRLATDQGEIKLAPAGAQPRLVKQQPGAIATEGLAKGSGWTVTTAMRTEFDGFMKLQTRFEGPADAEVRELRISFPLQFADEQLFGFYTGEAWFRAAHEFRILPKGEGVVFASNQTGRQHPASWAGKVSFLPYVTIGDDWRSFCWLSENDHYWTQSWTRPAITISRANGLTMLNLNIINSATRVKEPLTYTFGLQATPIRPLGPGSRPTQNGFSFGMVCGFNGWYLQAPFEGHLSFRLSPKDLDWAYPTNVAKAYRDQGRGPLVMYLDRTWQRAPEDAVEYNRDWRGWGDAVRYTKPVRDCYAWYVNEWIRRGIMEGIYIDDAWIDPTKALSHLGPKDNLAYPKAPGQAADLSDREWGFEFFDYRELLKRIRWLFLDNQVRPLIVTHTTQTPYYPVFAFVDLMLEGEDRYLSQEGEGRDFISSWGLPRLRYASPQKWGVPVQWLPIRSEKLVRSGLPMDHWYYQQDRAFLANLLLHDVGVPGGFGSPHRDDISTAGGYAGEAKFLGYWEPGNPFVPQEPDSYASVYQLPKHLTVVLVNAGPKEKVVDFALDPAKVKALLATDGFTIADVDHGTIPPVDKEYAILRSGGAKVTAAEAEMSAAGDQALGETTEKIIRELQTAEKKKNDPDGFFEYHNFRYEHGVLRLRIQQHDYRLLMIAPAPALPPL